MAASSRLTFDFKSLNTFCLNGSNDINLLCLPQHVLVKTISLFSYAEIAELRKVCQMFNSLCKMRLTDGFRKVDQFHSVIHKQVKSQLPRRESERHNHPLARHVNILSAVETRLSLLSMTFTKYIDSDLCCFIPGKVLDELFSILRSLQCINTKPPRAHEFLQELRDISSMAMEHFDECIVPILKQQMPSSSTSFNNSLGFLGEPDESFGSMASPGHFRPVPSPRQDNSAATLRLQTQVKILKKGYSESKSKVSDQRKLISEQDKKIAEVTTRLDRQDTKISDMTQKMLLYEKKFSDIVSVLPKIKNCTEASRTEININKESDNTHKSFFPERQLRSSKRIRSSESNLNKSKESSNPRKKPRK